MVKGKHAKAPQHGNGPTAVTWRPVYGKYRAGASNVSCPYCPALEKRGASASLVTGRFESEYPEARKDLEKNLRDHCLPLQVDQVWDNPTYAPTEDDDTRDQQGTCHNNPAPIPPNKTAGQGRMS
jgi:hypothetical protein